MLKVMTTEQIRAVEQAADQAGYSYAELMGRAGRAAADRAKRMLRDLADPQITLLIGPGNNGGDGMVTGLFLAQDLPSANVRFYQLSPRQDDFTEVARQAGLMIVNAKDDHDKRLLRNMVASADLVVDALFGIGVRLPLRDEAARVLRAANQAIRERRAETQTFTWVQVNTPFRPASPRLLVLALDCPSGTDADSGALDKNALDADETITFIAAKHGLFTFPSAQAVGNLSIAPLDLPPSLPPLQAVQDVLINADLVRTDLPHRPLNAHKGTFGHALIIGGSQHYQGAPLLAAQAAYRVGAGLVEVALPSSLVSSAGYFLEAIWISLDEDQGAVAAQAWQSCTGSLAKATSLLVGPGMGQSPASLEFLLGLLGYLKAQAWPHTLVLDADALNLLASQPDWWSLLPPKTILTPHPGEMARLCGMANAEVQSDRIGLVRRQAQAWQTTLILKGAHSLIADPQGRLAVLPFKTDALAKAGSGDVLAGVIVGLLAQGLEPGQAARSGAYLHALAGQLAAISAGDSASVLAHEVTRALGSALASVR